MSSAKVGQVWVVGQGCEGFLSEVRNTRGSVSNIHGMTTNREPPEERFKEDRR